MALLSKNRLYVLKCSTGVCARLRLRRVWTFSSSAGCFPAWTLKPSKLRSSTCAFWQRERGISGRNKEVSLRNKTHVHVVIIQKKKKKSLGDFFFFRCLRGKDQIGPVCLTSSVLAAVQAFVEMWPLVWFSLSLTRQGCTCGLGPPPSFASGTSAREEYRARMLKRRGPIQGAYNEALLVHVLGKGGLPRFYLFILKK